MEKLKREEDARRLYVYIYIYICVCVCVCVCVCKNECTRTLRGEGNLWRSLKGKRTLEGYIYIYIYIYIYVCIYTYVCVLCVCVYMCVCMYKHACNRMLQKHVCETYTYIHTWRRERKLMQELKREE